jgi:flagellar hook-associated protein 3 FlgL
MTNIATVTQNQLMRARILEVQSEMSRAQIQVSTGKKTDVYSGLRSDARSSISLNAAKATIDTYRQTIASIKVRTQTMESVFNRIGDIAVEVRNTVLQVMGLSATPTGSSSAALKSLAQNRLKEISSLLNTEVDGRFLFSGLQLGTTPMIDPGAVGTAGTPLDTVATGAPALANTTASGQDFYNRIAGNTGTTTAVAAIGATTINVSGPPSGVQVGSEFKFAGHATVYTVTGVGAGTITIAGPGLTAAVASGEAVTYYGYVDAQRPSLYYQGDTTGAQISSRIDDGFDLQYGVRGDDTAFATIMRALYAVATTDLTTANEAGHRELSRLAMADLQTGFDEMQELMGVLGVQQNTMEQTDKRHADFSIIVQSQIVNVEDVDAAESLSRLQLLQTNLEASFRLLASTRDLTLVTFL